MRPPWLQREAERCLPEGTRCLVTDDGAAVYPALEPSVLKFSQEALRRAQLRRQNEARSAEQARAKRERRLYGPAQDGKAYNIGVLPGWW